MDNIELTETTSVSDYNYDKLNGWTIEHESILIEWADKAMCYRWLHSKSNNMYSRLNAWYTIPVIIISTLTGTANFAQQRIPTEQQNLFIMLVGCFNILAGIITTVQQFLKITQLNEAHRVSSIGWDKFYRNIKIELAKHPTERMETKQMIKISKEEFDRLIETSPNIPDKIILKFKKFVNDHDFDNKIIKPEICDVLISTSQYRNPWSNQEYKEKQMCDDITNRLKKKYKDKKIEDQQKRTIIDFISSFIDLNNREPFESEIIDNLKEKINVESIVRIIRDNNSLKVKGTDEELSQEIV